MRAKRGPAAIVLASVLLCAADRAHANGADLPPEVVLQGFARVEADQLELLLRIPLVLLGSFGLPKRGPGYLDLARIDEHLRTAAAAASRQVEVFADGVRLSPTTSSTRLALPSDRAFDRYETARAHLEGPALPPDTDLYWNQGFLDVALVYPISSRHAEFSVRVNVAPELGHRIRLHLAFLPAGGPARSFTLPPTARPVPLDPRPFQAAWTFLAEGFAAPFGVERLAFLLCLAAPFRRVGSLLAIVLVLSGLQALTLTAAALGAPPDWRMLAPLFDLGLAVAVVLLAIENAVAPSLRRRWLVGSVLGVLGGFGLGHRLADDWQFAGEHPAVGLASFNAGVALGEVAALLAAMAGLALVFRYATGRRLGVIILSLILGHAAWHWMLDVEHSAEHAVATILSTGSGAAVAWLIAMGLLIGGVAWFLPARFEAGSDAALRAVAGGSRPRREARSG